MHMHHVRLLSFTLPLLRRVIPLVGLLCGLVFPIVSLIKVHARSCLPTMRPTTGHTVGTFVAEIRLYLTSHTAVFELRRFMSAGWIDPRNETACPNMHNAQCTQL